MLSFAAIIFGLLALGWAIKIGVNKHDRTLVSLINPSEPGKVVSPGAYLRGMLTVWLACEIGGIIALIGCLVTRTLLPNLLPALVAFILFTPFWPSGRAMTHPVGNDDDFEIYEEPR